MDFDLNDLSPEDIIELAASLYEDGMEKEASEDDLPYGFDLNDLDVDEFLEFADQVAGELDEMEKEAMPTWMRAGKKAAGKAWRREKNMPSTFWGAHKRARAGGKMERNKTPMTSVERENLGTNREIRKKLGKKLALRAGGTGVAAVGTTVAVRRRKNRGH